MEFTEARKRMARMPRGAEHIDNPVSMAPGFRIGNVMSWPACRRSSRRCSTMWCRRSGPAPKLLSATIHCPHGEGTIGGPLGEIQKAHPDTIIGSYPKYLDGAFWTELVVRSRDRQALAWPRRRCAKWSNRAFRLSRNACLRWIKAKPWILPLECRSRRGEDDELQDHTRDPAGQGRCSARIGCAVPLAVQHEAHLIGLHAEALPIPHATPMGIPDTGFIEAGSEIARERAAEIEAIFTKHCGSGGLSGEWRAMESFSGDSATSGLESARCADLVIAQQRDPDSETIVADLEALLFHSGRPALFVPYAIKVEPPFKRVTLAWNGSPESARAAFDALPFLKAARDHDPGGRRREPTASQDDVFSGTAIAAALSRHGVKVTIQNQHSGDVSAADIIQNHVSDNRRRPAGDGRLQPVAAQGILLRRRDAGLLQSMTCATFMSR
jgi:hypothetical protein